MPIFKNWLTARKIKLQSKIKELEQLEEELGNKVVKLELKQHELENDLQQKNSQLSSLKKELGEAQGFITMEEYGVPYKPESMCVGDIEYSIFEVKRQIAYITNSEGLAIITSPYTLNDSLSKGQQAQKSFCDGLIYAFNSYCQTKIKSVTTGNIEKTKDLITKKFNAYNKKAVHMGVKINEKYLDFVLKLVQLELDNKLAKAQEKECLRKEKQMLREQEKLLAEAEKAKLELQKQRRMYEQSLSKALNEQERKEFEAKLKEIDKREADVDYRINNSKAGYLYIAATKAMPDCCKLGVTRRLNPLVRLSELSSASVPFPFVCYGLVFSDNAFDLETRIHEYFDNKRVNQENKHKEFFYITPQEAIKVLKDEFGCDVHFVNEDESGELEDGTN